jgi:hypothetical protein
VFVSCVSKRAVTPYLNQTSDSVRTMCVQEVMYLNWIKSTCSVSSGHGAPYIFLSDKHRVECAIKPLSIYRRLNAPLGFPFVAERTDKMAPFPVNTVPMELVCSEIHRKIFSWVYQYTAVLISNTSYIFTSTTVNPSPARRSKAERSVNPRWTNTILYGINTDMGTWPWKTKVNK